MGSKVKLQKSLFTIEAFLYLIMTDMFPIVVIKHSVAMITANRILISYFSMRRWGGLKPLGISLKRLVLNEVSNGSLEIILVVL
jgi:hypothetical protein